MLVFWCYPSDKHRFFTRHDLDNWVDALTFINLIKLLSQINLIYDLNVESSLIVFSFSKSNIDMLNKGSYHHMILTLFSPIFSLLFISAYIPEVIDDLWKWIIYCTYYALVQIVCFSYVYRLEKVFIVWLAQKLSSETCKNLITISLFGNRRHSC